MSLTGKEKRALRAKGNRLKPVMNIGKSGISDNVIGELSLQLKSNKLIKVKLGSALASHKKEAAAELAEKTNSELVQLFGFTVLLYKEKCEE
jgi:RNA-binding protein